MTIHEEGRACRYVWTFDDVRPGSWVRIVETGLVRGHHHFPSGVRVIALEIGMACDLVQTAPARCSTRRPLDDLCPLHKRFVVATYLAALGLRSRISSKSPRSSNPRRQRRGTPSHARSAGLNPRAASDGIGARSGNLSP